MENMSPSKIYCAMPATTNLVFAVTLHSFDYTPQLKILSSPSICALEGMSFEAVSGLPYVKPSIPTLQRWIHGAALHAESLHHQLLCQQRLTPPQLQLDELRTNVRQSPDSQAQTWIWTGLCSTHKLWLVLAVVASSLSSAFPARAALQLPQATAPELCWARPCQKLISPLFLSSTRHLSYLSLVSIPRV